MPRELFESRNHTRLKQIQHLIATKQIDTDFFWVERISMMFTETKIPGVLVIELEKREDSRGYFARAWCAEEFEKHGLPQFVQTNMSMSRRKGTVRGLHYQVAAARRGQVHALHPRGDLRRRRGHAPGFTDLQASGSGIELTADNRKAIFIPEGLAACVSGADG